MQYTNYISKEFAPDSFPKWPENRKLRRLQEINIFRG